MEIDRQRHILQDVKYIETPNCDVRPDEQDINLVVIHSISLPPGEYGGPWIEKLFTNTLPGDEHPYFMDIHQMKVSAHVLIKRDGDIVQFVPFNKRAWHAGESAYRDRNCCNDFSIGIELEGTDTGPFEDIQYDRLAQIIDALISAYPSITRDNITGHSDIAPERKTDPGTGFEWDKLYSMLA